MQIIKNLLWLDCIAGAIAGTLVIFFSAWLSDLYSTPHGLLLFIGAVNLLYACYSFSLAIRAKRPVFLINILIMANGIWALVCLGIVARPPGDMTLLGYTHIGGEAIFVGGLAISEWKWRNQLLTTA
jgi:hypothetical protein